MIASARKISFSTGARQFSNHGKDGTFITDGFDLSCYVFSSISRFLERILMEHIDMKNSLDS